MAQFAIDEILTTGIQISGFVFDRSYSLGTAGQVLTSTSSGVMWQADSSIIDLSALSGQIVSTGALLNNRINSLSGYVNGTFVSGSGVANYVARWSNTKELLTGSIYDLGTGIGIGTTSPAAKLEVKGADGAVITAIFQSFAGNPAYNGGIQLGNAVANQNSQIYHSSAGDNTLTFVSNYAGGTANKFIFAPGGTETVRFQQNGRVGIGFQTPTETLDVSGRVRAIGEVFTLNAATLTDSQTSIALSRLGAITDQKYWEILSYNAAANGDFVIRTINDAYSNAAEGMRIVRGSSYNIASVLFPNGKVGIGTASPTALLSVGGPGSTSAASGLTFGGDAQANLYRSAEDTIKTDGSLVVAVNATFAGNVGIGLTNPAVKLDVSGGNARFSDYIIIGEDLAYPSNTNSAYLGYSSATAYGPQSNLELIDALSNAIGVNDPLRFKTTISGQYFSGSNWYADPSPLPYRELLNGNANSYLNLVTSSEYSVGISGKRFVADLGDYYRRPNFILLNTDWNQAYWGFKLNVENSNDLINWTTSISEQTFTTDNTRGTIALSIANSIQGNGLSRYFRFSFVANQAISAGALVINKIRSFGNQNYSSYIPVSTSSTGHLIASVGIISPTITSLSGNLAATGSTLDTKINTLSGYSNANFATILNLAATGSTLDTKINTTNTNLAATGSTLDTKINTLSGYSNANFATILNLAATGSTLDTKINTLSGYTNSTFLSGQGVANWTARWNGTKELITGSIYDIGTAVGIGTTNPLAKLQISRNGDNGSNGLADYGMVTVSSGSATQATLGAEVIGDGCSNLNLGSNIAGVRTFWHISKRLSSTTSPHSLQYFYYDGSNFNQLFTFATGGNLGVGTNNPSAKLDIRQSSATTALKVFTNDTSAAYIAQFIGYDNTLGDTTRMVIQAGGSVGIGTLTPASRLAVEGGSISTVNATGTDVKLSFDVRALVGGAVGFNNTAATNIYGVATGLAYLGVAQAYPLVFTTNGTERLRIAAGGNVGIGSTNPAYKLDVNGSAGFTNGITVNADASSTSYFVGANGTRPIIFQNNTASAYDFGFKFTDLNTFTLVGGNTLANPTTDLVSFTYDGKVGIGITVPTSKLNVVETTPTGTRIQLGTLSTNVLMNSGSTNDLLILNAPYGDNPATTSNLGAKWGIKFVGSLESNQIDTIGKTSAIYAVSEDTLGYNRGTSLAFYTNQLNDVVYAERMRIYHNGNIGIGITNPSNKLHISGGGISFTTSTGLAVPMIGLTAVNVAYIGPYTTSTDGNAPTLVVFNQGSSVQQTYFYSSGRIAMVLNKEGRLNIAGNAGNTPPALLNVGPASSVDAVSGMSFGNDSSANLYRSAASTIKTDGNINIVGTATLGPTVVNGGTLPSSPTGSTVVGFNYNINNGNISQVNFVEKRFATGGDWTTATTRIQKRVDVTDQAYIEFNPSGALYGMALGVAAGGSFEAMRILSNGRIGIGTTNPTAKLSLNKGSKDQFLALDIANNDQKYALYVDQDNNGSNSFSVWDATNSHTAIRYLPSSAGYWQLYTNDIERVRIDNNGNVGVGTTSMVGKLDVYANTDGPLLSFVRNASAGSSAYSAFVLRRDGNNNGIVLFTNSSTRSTDGGTGNSTIRTDYGNLNFGAGGSQHILTTAGNVGINTTTPQYRLDVNSSIVSRSTLSSPRFSSAGTYVYGVTNSPTWVIGTGSSTNNNATAPDGTTSAGTYTLSAVSASFDLYQTIAGLTVGRVYTVGMWVKLGTATNFCVVVNNSIAWNTIGGKAFTSSDGLSSGKWTHISYTFSLPAGSNQINLHIGYHGESAVTQQTAGTVFLWNIEMTEFSSTWIGNVEDEIRLPGSSIWTSRGSVGIGQTNPLSKFVVSGGTVNTTTYTTSEARIADGSLHLMKTVAGGIFESIRAMNMDTTAGTTVRVLAASTSDPFNNGNGGKVFIDAIRTATNMDLAFSLNDVAGAAAVERVRFMGNGNVGIGVTNPVYKLQLQANNPNNGVLAQFYNYNAGAAGANGAFSIWTQYGIADWFIGQPSGVNALTFGRDKTSSATGVEYMRIDAGGNIGIGITNPACKLDVAGTIRSSTSEIYGFGASDNVSLRAASTSNVLGIYTSNVERLRLAANGYFGVGTDNPSTLLSIGRAGSTAATSGITFGADSQANLYRISSARIKTDGNFTIDGQGGGATSLVLNRSSTSSENGMAFNTAGSVDWYFFINDGGTDLQIQRSSEIDSAPRVRFNGSNKDILFNLGGGNIGVGTSIPTGKVHIVSSIVGETVLRADGTNGTLFSVVDDLSDSLMSVNNSAGLPVLEVFADDRVVAGQYGSGDFVVANNKVGIGTTNPINKLSVIGAASIGSTSYNIAAPTNGLLVEGNVGIGTTSVGNPLEVYGTSMDPSLTPSAASIFSVNSLGVELAVGRMVTSPFSIWLQGKHATVGGNLTYPIVLNPLGGNVGIGVTNPAWSLDVSGTAVRSFASGAVEPGFIADYASSNGYGGFFVHTNGVRKWRIAVVGDTNTSPALSIWQEGIGSRMHFRNNGAVGVGTTIPDTKLSIGVASDSALGSTSDGLKITDGTRNVQLLRNGTGYNYAGVVGSGSMLYSYDRMYIVADTSNPILFHTNGAERVRIGPDGNVGIGTTAPTNKLQVVGQIAIKGDESADNAKMYFQASDNSNRYTIETDLDGNTVNDLLIFRSNTVDNMLVLKGNGNVGIGTTNPAHKLEVFNTANSQTYVRVNNQDTGSSAYAGLDLQSYGGGWQVRVPASTTFVNPLLFSFNEAERARITSDGKVGIGTTNPVATLDIENPASNLPILNLGGGEAGNAVSDLYVLNSYNNNTGVGYAAKVIGVNISGSLTATNIPVQRTVWGGVTSATAIALGTDGPRAGAQDNAFQIWTTNDGVAGTQLTQKFSVSSAGDVGIGIVTPTDKIQISGGGISLTTSTGLAVPMLGMTPLNIAYVGPYNTPTDGNAPSTVLFNHGASVQQTWFYSSGSVAMVLNRQGRLHIGNLNNAPNCLLSVGPSNSTTAVSGMCFGNDAQANLYRSAEDTIKTDGNLSVAGTLTVGGAVSLNGHIYGNKSVTLSTASWTTVLTVNLTAHTSCYVKIGAFGDWSNHSAIAFVSELFIQNGDNAYNTPGTVITAHDNTGGTAGDKIDIQIVDPAATGTQNFLIQLKLISATSSTNSSIITYHVMGQQASVT